MASDRRPAKVSRIRRGRQGSGGGCSEGAGFFTEIKDEALDVVDIVDVGEKGDGVANREATPATRGPTSPGKRGVLRAEPESAGARALAGQLGKEFQKKKNWSHASSLLGTIGDRVVGAALEQASARKRPQIKYWPMTTNGMPQSAMNVDGVACFELDSQ